MHTALVLLCYELLIHIKLACNPDFCVKVRMPLMFWVSYVVQETALLPGIPLAIRWPAWLTAGWL